MILILMDFNWRLLFGKPISMLKRDYPWRNVTRHRTRNWHVNTNSNLRKWYSVCLVLTRIDFERIDFVKLIPIKSKLKIELFVFRSEIKYIHHDMCRCRTCLWSVAQSTDTYANIRHDMDPEMLTPTIMWINDIIQCNHICRKLTHVKPQIQIWSKVSVLHRWLLMLLLIDFYFFRVLTFDFFCRLNLLSFPRIFWRRFLLSRTQSR